VIEVNTDPRLAPPTEEEAWAEQFNDLADEFNASLDVFAKEAFVISGVGSRFFWVGGDERLHSYDVSSMKRVDYEIPISLEVYPPFKVGADAIITAEYSIGVWEFSAYAMDEPNALIDTITWPVGAIESLGASRLRVALDDGSVYLFDSQKVLHRWRPGMGAPEPLFSLADRGLLGGRIPKFSVHSDDVLVLKNNELDPAYDESGALWHVQISGGEAEQVEESATDLCFQAGDALYRAWTDEETLAGFRYSSSDRHTEDLTALVSEANVDLGDFGIDKRYYSHLYDLECQPGGFTFENNLGWFFLDPKEHEARTLYLRRNFISYEKDYTFEVYLGAVVVEHVAFLWRYTCALGDVTLDCTPPAVYTRDLSAH
jgi:hypothetical protein